MWKLKTFDELTTTELYDLLRLRAEVFVVEQTCPFNDCDNYDSASLHLWREENGAPVAYARILPPGVYYKEASIGRVVVPKSHRNTGAGVVLMEEALRAAKTTLPEGKGPVKIMAQQYLERWYEQFGFKTTSEPFLEDDIWHIEMILEF